MRGQNRILLVMATGTGKTYTAFQIIWRPCAIIRTSGFAIAGKNESLAVKRRLLPLTHIPMGNAAYSAIQNKENQIAFSETVPYLWLARTNPAIHVYECTPD